MRIRHLFKISSSDTESLFGAEPNFAPEHTDVLKLGLWMSISTPCLPTQAFCFQWQNGYEKVAVLHLCAASVKAKKMAQKTMDPTCAAL